METDLTSDDDIFHDAESFLSAVKSTPMGLPYRSRIYETCEAIRSVHSAIEAAPEPPDTAPMVEEEVSGRLLSAQTLGSAVGNILSQIVVEQNRVNHGCTAREAAVTSQHVDTDAVSLVHTSADTYFEYREGQCGEYRAVCVGSN